MLLKCEAKTLMEWFN